MMTQVAVQQKIRCDEWPRSASPGGNGDIHAMFAGSGREVKVKEYAYVRALSINH